MNLQMFSHEVLCQLYLLAEYQSQLPEPKQKSKILISKLGNNCFSLCAMDIKGPFGFVISISAILKHDF
jgi:hypothetical protein